ncbi:MAG: sulfatase-like hydrolase/transferase [Bacteroidota bacterium]
MAYNNFIKVLFILWFCHIGSTRIYGQEDEKKLPNIVFIFTDDQGWGDVGAYGHPKVKTPNLDQLANEGMLLTQFYVGSPVCSPSRATLLTGRFAPETGIHYAIGGPAGNRYNSVKHLDPELPNIYKTFVENGYKTGHYGKWHLGHGEDAPEPADYGVEEYRVTNGNGPKLSSKKKKLTNANKSEVTADYGVEFIRRNKNSPFFLSLWINDPHAVLDPTEEQMAPYLGLTHKAVRDKMRNSQTVYYSIISSIDKAVGRVVQQLEDLGLRENTIIIFSSDNGPSPLWSAGTGHAGSGLAGPFRGVKGSLYEGGIRVPFIVSYPGAIPKGVVENKSVVGAVDMYPTLANLAGLDIKLVNNLDGEDRSEVFRGNSSSRENPMMWEYRMGNWGRSLNDSPRLVIRDGDWKLLMNPDRSRVELYNLEEDRNETENRARYEKDILADLENKLMTWWKDEVPNPEKAPTTSGQIKWKMPQE